MESISLFKFSSVDELTDIVESGSDSVTDAFCQNVQIFIKLSVQRIFDNVGWIALMSECLLLELWFSHVGQRSIFLLWLIFHPFEEQLTSSRLQLCCLSLSRLIFCLDLLQLDQLTSPWPNEWNWWLHVSNGVNI